MIIVIGKDGFLGTNLYLKLHSLSQDVIFLTKKDKTKMISKNCKVLSYSDFIKKVDDYSTKVRIIVYILPPNSLFDSSTNILDFVINDVWKKSNAKFIYISSGGAVYGNTKNQPILENDATKPVCDYGHSKLDEECRIKDAGSKLILNWNILRPSNPIGKYQSKSLLLNIFQSHLCKSTIYLDDNGEQIRDFFSIDSLVDAISLLIDDNKNYCETFNVGSSLGININDFVNEVMKICKISNLDTTLIKTNKLSVKKNVLDCSKIEKKLGWNNTKSLNTSILDAWNHFKKNKCL